MYKICTPLSAWDEGVFLRTLLMLQDQVARHLMSETWREVKDFSYVQKNQGKNDKVGKKKKHKEESKVIMSLHCWEPQMSTLLPPAPQHHSTVSWGKLITEFPTLLPKAICQINQIHFCFLISVLVRHN